MNGARNTGILFASIPTVQQSIALDGRRWTMIPIGGGAVRLTRRYCRERRGRFEQRYAGHVLQELVILPAAEATP